MHTIKVTLNNCRSYRSYYGHCRNVNGVKSDRNGDPVEMRLTFAQWLWIWLSSGHFYERGTAEGQYVMARKNDIGHYEVGNVFIQLHSENVRQGNTGVPKSQAQKAKLSAAMTGIKRPTIKCRHCGKEGVVANINRWHNDNCSSRTVAAP